MRNAMWFLALLFIAAAAVAQEGPPHPLQGSELDSVALPGQFWSSTGNTEPVLKNDVLNENYIEQGATFWSTPGHTITFTPYAALGFAFDTQGYSYNNKLDPSIGVKLNKYFSSGVISAGTSYNAEHRFDGGGTSSAPAYYISYWYGWNPISDKKSRFPGSSWGEFGAISPVEHGNWILLDYVTQAYTAKRFGTAQTQTLMPYAEFTIGKDTKGFDWENKTIEGAGIKYGMPHGYFYSELGAGFTHETRFESGQQANGFKVFLNFSYAWGLFGRRDRD
jgi:hypothetical protein